MINWNLTVHLTFLSMYIVSTKVHSFLKQCFAWSSFDTIWWYLQLMSAEVSLKISWRYHQIVSIEDRAKQCFKNKCALVNWEIWTIFCGLLVLTIYLKLYTLPIAEILSGKNVRAFLVCGFLMKSFKKNILKIWKKSWEPFESYLLNSTANPAHFHPNWAGLAVQFSRQLLNGSPDFFFVFIF